MYQCTTGKLTVMSVGLDKLGCCTYLYFIPVQLQLRNRLILVIETSDRVGSLVSATNNIWVLSSIHMNITFPRALCLLFCLC